MLNAENNEAIKQDKPAAELPGKKPYEKPQIIYHKPLEAMAILCIPAPPGKGIIGGVDGCTVTFS